MKKKKIGLYLSSIHCKSEAQYCLSNSVIKKNAATNCIQQGTICLPLVSKKENGTVMDLNSVVLILIKQPNICLLYLNVDVSR